MEKAGWVPIWPLPDPEPEEPSHGAKVGLSSVLTCNRKIVIKVSLATITNEALTHLSQHSQSSLAHTNTIGKFFRLIRIGKSRTKTQISR